ncbi:MAG: type II toxin-antitoxin system HicB family antitoxin [Planctomycetota bacterium]
MKTPTYIVCDGDLTLKLEPAGDGWYAVTSPLDPELITQAKTIPEAFEMARDALAALQEARKVRYEKLAKLASA